MEVNVGDSFKYISETEEYSFDFMVFGIHKDNLDIIVNRDTKEPSLYKLQIAEMDKCIKTS